MSEYRIKGETLTGIADAIRSKTGGTEPIPVPEMAAQIEGITGGGGGSSADVHYVTFKSYDGSEEYGKKAVAVGDDCADPIARGVFDTPTRESDAQYNYAFAGWSKNPDNVLDDTALDAVTEDRVVYAAFAAVVKTYTITYYDGDALLTTQQVAYGDMPSYLPTKEGYMLIGWEPSLVAVTGDATYYAQWTDDVSFATASFDAIRAVLETGQASAVWTQGDTRLVPITLYDDTVLNVNFSIRLVGKDNVIIVSEAVFDLGLWCNEDASHNLNTSDDTAWHISHIRDVYNENIFGGLPSEMQGLVALRTHSSRVAAGGGTTSMSAKTTSDRVWIPSNSEMSGTFFTSNSDRIKYQQTESVVVQTAVQYCTRDMRDSKWWRPSYVDINGAVINGGDTTPYSVSFAPIAMKLSVT